MTDNQETLESLQFEYAASKHNLNIKTRERDEIKDEFIDKVRENHDTVGLEDMKRYMQGHLHFHIADDQALAVRDKLKAKTAENKPQDNFLDALANTELQEGREWILAINAKYRCDNPQEMLEILDSNPRDPKVTAYLNRLIHLAVNSFRVSDRGTDLQKKESSELELQGLLKCSNILSNKTFEDATADVQAVLFNAEQFSLSNRIAEIFDAPPNDRRIAADLIRTFVRNTYQEINRSTTDAYLGDMVSRAAGVSMFVGKIEESIKTPENQQSTESNLD